MPKQQTNVKIPDNVEEEEEDEEEEEEEKEDEKGGSQSKQEGNEIRKLGVTETDSVKRSAAIADSPENHDINTSESKESHPEQCAIEDSKENYKDNTDETIKDKDKLCTNDESNETVMTISREPDKVPEGKSRTEDQTKSTKRCKQRKSKVGM